MMRAMRIAILPLLLISPLAWAAAPARFALDQLHLSGNVSAAERKVLEERVWNTVELLVADANAELVHREDLTAAIARHPELKSCDEARCWLRLGDLLGVARVIAVTAERSGPEPRGEWKVRVDEVVVPTARALPSLDVPCHSCTADELVGDLSHAIGPLLKIEPPGPLCTLTVTSEPAGATVRLDATTVGATPFTHTVEPGARKVKAVLPGYSPAEDGADCPAGGRASVNLTLTSAEAMPFPVAEAPAPARRSPALKIVGATLLVLGAAGVIAGAIGLARDGTGSCDKTGTQKQCPEIYDTGVAGGALVGVGAAGLVAGAAVLIVDGVRKPRVAADLRIGPNLAVVGIKVSL
jgi:hypothetical protein